MLCVVCCVGVISALYWGGMVVAVMWCVGVWLRCVVVLVVLLWRDELHWLCRAFQIFEFPKECNVTCQIYQQTNR